MPTLPRLRLLGLILFACGSIQAGELPERVDFNWHVKPILSDRCFFCHGPDSENRQADLRLDVREAAFAELPHGEGTHVIRPGQPDQSEVYLRISTEDESSRMPPPESKLNLTSDEREIIRRWIQQGAQWKEHWSLLPLEEVPVPEVQSSDWAQNEIDHFVLARLEREQLQPAAETQREQLIRRVTFDLTGLPPTLEEIDAFLGDESSDAYERVVDRLLASTRFGERMAVDWLDTARYADTFGYQADVYRDVWPYRDWVIRAFNENLPYDQFLTWQLAGDMLPEPTRDQLIATAFNRLHRQTNEGGSIEEEFQAEYVADRTNTFGAAILGLTLECARCHEHKYDPISQQDYYRFFAFFNNLDECGLYSHFTNAMPTPTLLLTNEQQDAQIAAAEAKIEAAERKIAELSESREDAFQEWIENRPQEPIVSGLIGDYPMESIENNQLANRADPSQPAKVADNPAIAEGRHGNGLKLSGENNVTTSIGGNFTRDDAFSISLWIQTPDHKDRAVVFHRSRAWTDAGSRGYQLLIEDGDLSASLIHFWPGNAIRIRTKQPTPIGQWVHVAMTYDGSSRADGLALYIDGVKADCDVVRDNLYKDITGGGANSLTLGQRFRDRGFKDGSVDELQIYDRCLTPIEAAQIADGQSLVLLQKTPTNELTGNQRKQLRAYYLANFDEPYLAAIAQLHDARTRRSKLVEPIQELMVMQETPGLRETHLLRRGAYDAPGEKVEPDTPASILPFSGELPRNRLGLACWLTDPKHPLTARVAVNRFWQSMFGRGLVATPEDFGAQGQLPTHPELLDWQARSFIDSGWDVKALVKRMVMSATYRQSSHCVPEIRAKDPENQWLSRGPRYRRSAEMVRDNALAASGLLVERMGGPPVKPYQPEGLWKEKSGQTYQRDKDEGSHRRSIYTYWKRTSPPPAMMTLDAAKRDVCVVKRQTTATPLQALLLLNDPQYVEAARALAQRAMRAEDDQVEQVRLMFRLLTSREPTELELAVLQALYARQLETFNADKSAAEQLLAVGDAPVDPMLDTSELAAMTVVAEMLLNYDETVMKR